MHVLMTNHEFQSLFLRNYRSEIAIGCFNPMVQTNKKVLGWEVDEFFRCIEILIFRELHKFYIDFSQYPNICFLRNYRLNFHYQVWYPELQTYIEVREWKVNDVGPYIGNLTVRVFWNTINIGLPRYFNSFFHIYTDFMSCIKMSRERSYLRLTFRSEDYQYRRVHRKLDSQGIQNGSFQMIRLELHYPNSSYLPSRHQSKLQSSRRVVS